MADVHAKLDELTALVESAKSMPLSSSCVLPRVDLLAALDELRQLLPTELAAASDVLSDRASVLADARAEAAEILAAATAERDRLINTTEVAQAAQREAEQLMAEAAESTRLMRSEVEDYVDGKLANFEVVLHKTLAAVGRGRDKLRGADGATGDLRGDVDLADAE